MRKIMNGSTSSFLNACSIFDMSCSTTLGGF